MKKHKLKLLFTVFAVILLGYFSMNYKLLFIKGSSMKPTFLDKQIVLIKKHKTPQVGDIVVFNSPVSWHENDKRDNVSYVKRIIAGPGDRVDVSSDGLAVNNSVVYDNTKKCLRHSSSSVLLSNREYFVMGDNHGYSNDSYTQFCEGNDDILISEQEIWAAGHSVLILGGNDE